MFRGPPTPIVFIALIILAVAFPQSSQSQSDIGQLEGMTGQKIGRFVFSGMRAPMRGIGEIGGRGYDADAMHHRELLAGMATDSQNSAQRAAPREAAGD